MDRVFNFSAGPAVLPEAVLREAAAEMLNYKGSGLSVMEMSHRSSTYQRIIDEAEASLRTLAGIPDNYEVLFLQGGASQQFAAVPLNLMVNRKADYIHTGMWTKKAIAEGQRYGDIKVLASSEAQHFASLPDLQDLAVRDDADYVYICENNTIYGTRYTRLPDTKGKPLVSDASSCFLAQPVDITDYGLIFAGAQKNFGPAGVTLVIVRKDLIRNDVLPFTPTMLKYKTHADEHSLFNTPPTYGIYICGKITDHFRLSGGLAAMEERNIRKAGLLYDYLDQSRLFSATVFGEARSLMNVPFVTGDDALDRAFIAGAEAVGLIQLKGHRSVGGMRASIYNSMPYEGVQRLVDYMADFERAHKEDRK